MTSAEKMLKKLRTVSAYVLRAEGNPQLFAEIVFVGPREIRELNKRYRGKDKVTDVLSFNEEDEGNYLGEILLCRSYLRAQAHEYGVPYEEELMRMTIHGTLHLLGYDHMKQTDAKKMLPRQEKYLEHFLGSL